MAGTNITDTERKVMAAMADTDTDFAYLPFRCIADRSGLDMKRVRRPVRSLARKGMARFARGLFTEDGEVAGSGYALTDLGRALARLSGDEE